MKTRPAVGCLIAIVAFATGLAGCSKPAADAPAPAPVTTAETPAPAKTIPPAPAPAKPPVMIPVIAPAKSPLVADAPAAPPANTASRPATDPQKDLETALPDALSIVQSGDLKTFVLTYTLPGKDRDDFMSMLDPTQDPDFQKLSPQAQAMVLQGMPEMAKQIAQGMAQGLAAIQNETPTYNDTGDKATYKVNLPPSGANSDDASPDSITFVKVNDQWFVDMEDSN
jgi:hypothetical protein